MEDPNVLSAQEGQERGLTAIGFSDPLHVTVPMKPHLPSETSIENQAVSMADYESSPALSSPAEASPAKPATTLPDTTGTTEMSPTTSVIASASDSLTSTGTSLVTTETAAESSNPAGGMKLPAMLTFKGVSVTLENNSVWQQFHSFGTEMILTKQGRRMFPYCRYRLAGLEPTRKYNLVLSIVPADQLKYRWSVNKWEASGPAEYQTQGLMRAFSHQYSPCLGSEWMSGMVSFYKLKLTNNMLCQEGHVILHSMHRYIPRLHVIPVPDGEGPTADQPLIKGPESMTFTFPQTEFITVTTYQNLRITRLKINYNPFAKGFREDGLNNRFLKTKSETSPAESADTLPPAGINSSASISNKVVEDHSTKKRAISASNSEEWEAETQAKQKKTDTVSQPAPIASIRKMQIDVDNVDSDHPHTECLKGKLSHSPKMGSLETPVTPTSQPSSPVASVKCDAPPLQMSSPLEPETQCKPVSIIPKMPKCIIISPKQSPTTPAFPMPISASTPGCQKKRKKINRKWGNSRGREGKGGPVSSKVLHSPSLTVAMQPELDDVEGLLFVSFTTKEALGIHVGDKLSTSSSPVSPVSLTLESPSEATAPVEEVLETDEEKIARLQAILLQDLSLLKHRQVIHPVLQDVGLKLSSLDPTKAIDLQYLGIRLPLPSPVSKANTKTPSPAAWGLPFVSRTGKTSDLTKIKGWREKFIRRKESSPSNQDGSQKDLSAFCSNVLDKYLESEAQQISERAAAFSTIPESSVTYQLPVKSSSYVKTLDSALKHRKPSPILKGWANRPCPLSYKPLLYSALTKPAPTLASTPTSVQEATKPQANPISISPKASPVRKAGMKTTPSLISQSPVVNQKPGQSCGQSQGMPQYRISGLCKFQLRLAEMEDGALNQGLNQTQLTTERLTVALSVMLTAKMLPSQRLSVPQYKKAEGPKCGKQFCRLGCVCSSLNRLNRGPLHCRRPSCMFGCTCFKRKIIKKMTLEMESQMENELEPVYSLTNMENEVDPSPGSHSDKLWDRNTGFLDPDPLFSPTVAMMNSLFAYPNLTPTSNPSKRYVPRLNEPINEEDKDPVYKYFESLMTCARVREFRSAPPPQVSLQCKDTAKASAVTNTIPQKTLDSVPKRTHSTIFSIRSAGKGSLKAQSKAAENSKRVEIQSECDWHMDRKMVLTALCQHIKQNSLSMPFSVGPYCISPVSTAHIQKACTPTITYKVRIRKQKKMSDDEEEESDGSDEEITDKSSGEEEEPVEEHNPAEEPEVQIGVTPFLSGVLPAGRLRARKKPRGLQAIGLIQVNGKSYNQARLLLGAMGSLHPANRLAAYVMDRLNVATKIPPKTSLRIISNLNTGIPTPQLNKTAATVGPPRTDENQTKAHGSAKGGLDEQSQQAIQGKGPGTPPCPAQSSSAMHTLMAFAAGRHGSCTPSHNNYSYSPVSLTVSPSLKTPSFLGESGTYSFRICPPPAIKGSGHPSQRPPAPPGVTLPGGFTLIQLPKPGVDGAFAFTNKTNKYSEAKPPQQKDVSSPVIHSAASSYMDESGLASDEAHPGTRGLTNDRSVELGSSPQLMCDERMPSDESDDAEKCKLMRRVELDLDMGSDEVTSDSSDYDGDGDEESVDVETVEETELGVTIANMRAVASRSLRIWDSCEDSGSAKQHKVIRPNKKTAKKDVNKEKRKNHTVLERQRRSEQRYLFNQLQNILNCDDPRAPKLRILSLALSEIKTLMETSKCLEEKKRRLTQAQSVYVKKISNLAGKPEELIKVKLKEIYEKKLMAAQRRKSLSVNPRPQPQIPTLPVTECSKLQLNPMHKAQAKVPVPLATNTAHLHRLKPQSYVARTPASDQITSPKTTSTQSLMEDNPQVPVAPVQVITHQPLDNLEAPVTLTPIQITQPQSKVEDQVQMPLSPVIPQASEPQDGHHTPDPRSPNEVCTLKSDVPHKPAVVPPPPLTQKSESESEILHPSSRGKWVTLPLVRSKTGRIILPSSLKPARQGCFMLMVMGTDQEEDKNKADKSLTHTLLSDQSSLKDKNGSPSEAEQPLDNSEEGKSPDVSGPTEASKTSPNSLKNGQDVKSPLVELARLNKSILFPSVVLQPIGNNQEGDRMLNMSSKEMNAYLSLKPIDQPCTSKNLSQIPTPPVVRRGRGRPRKHALVIPVKQNKKISPVNKETSGQVKVRVVQDNPVPVKRRRGRPRKNFAAISKSLAVVTGSRQRKAESAPTERSRASSSLTNASQSQNSPFRLTRSQNRSITSHSECSELEYNTPRPVTRSALGKDFPSAKKKSWMDIEKELELE